MPGLQRSAVALLDVLGFKDRQALDRPAVIAKTLVLARQSVASVGKMITDHSGPVPIVTHPGWFSDTLCLVAQWPSGGSPGLPVDGQIINTVCSAVSTALYMAADDKDCPLVLRGVVTLGDALVEEDNIYFGSAIDEAASLHECAEGAFVSLSPGAASAIEATGAAKYLDEKGLLVRYEVPMKGGARQNTFVVSPAWIGSGSVLNEVRAGYEKAMSRSNRPDVAIKRENTVRFLDALRVDIQTRRPR